MREQRFGEDEDYAGEVDESDDDGRDEQRLGSARRAEMEDEPVEPGTRGEADVEHALHGREDAGARTVRGTVRCVSALMIIWEVC